MEIVSDTRSMGLGRKVYEIRPYPIADSGFIVGMYVPLTTDTNRVHDKHQYRFGVPGTPGSQLTAQKVLEDTVTSDVAWIKGANFNGQPMTKDHPDFLFFFLEQPWEDEGDGQIKDLWSICMRLRKEIIRSIAKNSRQSSLGSGATDSQSESL